MVDCSPLVLSHIHYLDAAGSGGGNLLQRVEMSGSSSSPDGREPEESKKSAQAKAKTKALQKVTGEPQVKKKKSKKHKDDDEEDDWGCLDDNEPIEDKDDEPDIEDPGDGIDVRPKKTPAKRPSTKEKRRRQTVRNTRSPPRPASVPMACLVKSLKIL